MAEEPSLSYYLPIAGGRIIGFIPFPRVLVLCEMQSVSSRIWTRIVVLISYGDNDYTTTPTNNNNDSDPRINANEEVLHIPCSSQTEASPPDVFLCHTQETLTILARRRVLSVWRILIPADRV